MAKVNLSGMTVEALMDLRKRGNSWRDYVESPIDVVPSVALRKFRNFRLRFAAISPTTKRGLKLPTIQLAEVGDGEVPD